MSAMHPLWRVLRDAGDDVLNGWTGYTTPDYVKQWYFVDNVPLGYVEGLSIHPSTVPNSFHYSFAREAHGSFASLDEAKAAMIAAVQKWSVWLLPQLGGTD